MRPFSLESWEQYSDGSLHQVVVAYDGKKARTYRDGLEQPNSLSLFDHCLSGAEVRNRFKEISGTPPSSITQSKEQILNRFIQ